MTPFHRPGRAALALLFTLAAGCANMSEAHGALPEPSADLPAGKPGETRTAVFAAGCFWCVEAVFEQIAGVSEVVSGFAGGTPQSATYEAVSSGGTAHAEAVRVTYDPSKVTYGRLLKVLFSSHDPTTKDRQGPDWGRQYRSAIFVAGDEERRVARAYTKQLESAKIFSAPIVTTLEPLDVFYPAEAYHQDFVARHPEHPYVRQWALPKLSKLKEKVPELLKR